MKPNKNKYNEVKKPKISAKKLAEFMAASERKRRTVLKKCRYQPIAPLIQHKEAKLALSKFIYSNNYDLTALERKSESLRNRLAEKDFDRMVADINADYIDQFRENFPSMDFPKAEILKPASTPNLIIDGVTITVEIHCKLIKRTRTNKINIGALCLRYAKGKALTQDEADWHSAFLHGYLRNIGVEENENVDVKLCSLLDVTSGIFHSAPSNSISRFNNMKAACATIAEQWSSIPPP